MSENAPIVKGNQIPMGGESLPAEVPHFITASLRLKEYLGSLSFPNETAAGRAEKYNRVMRSSDGLRDLAQTFEFMGMVPELADSDKRHDAGKQLAAELQNPEIPEGVLAIYREFFGKDVAAYADPTQ